MGNALHSAQTAADGNHVIQGFPDAANATARLAITVTATDIGRVVYQVDNKTFWILTNNVGPVWIDITGAAGTPAPHTHVEADITNLSHVDASAIHDNVAAEISAIAEKLAPVGTDFLLLEDSAAANAKRRIQIANLPGGGGGADVNAIHKNTAAEISTIIEKTIPVGADIILIEDSANANAKKRVQIANLPGGGGSVFGSDYAHAHVLPRTTTTLATFQTKTTMTTPALTGEYLLTWHATVDNNNKQGEVRMQNTTDALTVGAVQSLQLSAGEQLSLCGFDQITFSGFAKTFQIQWRDVAGGNVQGIQDAGIIFWRVA